MTLRILQLLLLLSAVPAAFGQNSGKMTDIELREFFQAKKVLLEVDMPASRKGILLKPEELKIEDRAATGQLSRMYGVSLHARQVATVTEVAIVNNEIEFQLDGGGYSSHLDPAMPKQLTALKCGLKEAEAELQREKNKPKPSLDRINALKAEIEGAKKCERQNEINQQNYQRALAKRADLIRQRRLIGGSRFTIRFNKRSVYDVSPEELMVILKPYVDFSPISSNATGPAAEDMPDKKPGAVWVNLYPGTWRNSKGETVVIENGTLRFGSGKTVEYHEVFRLATEYILVVETVSRKDEAVHFILIKASGPGLRIIYYDTLQDLQKGTNKKLEGLWIKQQN